MKWKMAYDGTVKDEDGNFICVAATELDDLAKKIIEKAPAMYEAISEFIYEVDHGAFHPKRGYKRFKEIISRIED